VDWKVQIGASSFHFSISSSDRDKCPLSTFTAFSQPPAHNRELTLYQQTSDAKKNKTCQQRSALCRKTCQFQFLYNTVYRS